MLLDEYTRINALYYPFSLCTNEIALKRFLLLFDTIGFIYPASSGLALTHFDFMQAVGRVSRRSPITPILPMSYRDVIGANLDIEKWKGIIVALEKEGIIVAIDPKPLVDQNDTLITYATLADFQNSEFQALMNKALTREFAKEFGDSYPQGGNNRNMVEIIGSVDNGCHIDCCVPMCSIDSDRESQ
jgi:hypothetical protein